MTEMSQAWWQKPKTSALETETGGPAWPIQLTTILNYRVRPSLKRKKKCRYEKATDTPTKFRGGTEIRAWG